MTSQEIKAEAHRIRNEARKHWGVQAGDKRDIRFINCWNMAANGQSLPWEIKMQKELTLTTKTGNRLELTINNSGLVAAVINHPQHGDMKITNPSIGSGSINGHVTFQGKEKRMRCEIDQAEQAKIYDIQVSLFNIAIPGYLDLTVLQRKFSNEERAIQRIIENGSSVFPKRTISHADIEAAHKKYPVASAYLKADGYHNAANYRKSNAGKDAKQALLDGADVESIMKEMRNWI